MNRKGFTLIELILVIAILGILAVSAIPNFVNLATNAHQSARDGVVGAVRSAVALYRANDMVTNGGAGNYPTTLDSNGNAACTTCFSTILATGVNNARWSKNGTTYTYNDGAGNQTAYVYNATQGTFQ
jgi:prepilin-type N-terminal cleavage/methylation domain-containing protein